MKWFSLVLAVPAALWAQGPRASMFPWWESPIVSSLNLTDTQQSQIRDVVRQYRGRMFEVRSAVDNAERELEDVFNSETVDAHRGDEAIERLSHARADMTKALSEMSLRLRAILTAQQWQELQKRQREQGIDVANRPPGRGRGRGPDGRRGPKAQQGSPQVQSPAQDAPRQSGSPKTALN